MKKRLLIFSVLFISISLSAQQIDKLYTPGGVLYPIAATDGVGINETTPDAALHINQSDDNGTALHIDLESVMYEIIGGGTGYTQPDFAVKINKISSFGSLTQLFSIDALGNTRVGYFGSGNEKLMVNSNVGIYLGSKKINLGFSGSHPELSWKTTGNDIFRFKNTTTGAIPISISSSGKVGIRTEDFTASGEYLTVNSGLGISYISTNRIHIGYHDDSPELTWVSPQNDPFRFKNSTTGKVPLALSADGQVGISSVDFTNTHDLIVGGSVYIKDDGEDEHSLLVDGSVYIKDNGDEDHSLYIEGSGIAEEMYVKVKATWPDYVFSDRYLLMPIDELSSYIKENGRLPKMPSADKVEAEGIATGETIRVLTEKVEELTLYLLQLQKEIDVLNKKLSK